MRTSFSSESNGEWRVELVAESSAEFDNLRSLFDHQPKGLPCCLTQDKTQGGELQARLIIFSPRPGR